MTESVSHTSSGHFEENPKRKKKEKKTKTKEESVVYTHCDLHHILYPSASSTAQLQNIIPAVEKYKWNSFLAHTCSKKLGVIHKSDCK